MTDIDKINPEEDLKNGCLFVGQPVKSSGQERCPDNDITTNEEFNNLTNNLSNKLHRAAYYTVQTPTPTTSYGSTLTPTPTPTKTPTLTKTPTNTNTPTASVTLSSSLTPTQTPTATPTATPTNTPSLTTTNTNTLTASVTLTPSQTITSTPTNTPTLTQSQTLTPTVTPTATSQTLLRCMTYNTAVSADAGNYTFAFTEGPDFVPTNVNHKLGYGIGTYILTGVPSGHPIAILNSGYESFISYAGDVDKKSTMVVGGVSYDFYYGNVIITVNGVGTQPPALSYYCRIHGYMGGNNRLIFSTNCNPTPTPTPTQSQTPTKTNTLTPTPTPTATAGAGGTQGFVVSGAGSPAFNGTYCPDGTLNGKTRYKLTGSNYTIEYTNNWVVNEEDNYGPTWLIQAGNSNSTSTQYYNGSSLDTPPLSGWATYFASSPAPTLSSTTTCGGST